ncbi:calcium-binding protein [Alteromonas sp. BMJM2]|uniref:calcium-binding protein n=1 Tax=Alteromonas sp. BMJM2 TaxID=2954241 RepID=UPI0022B4FF73|nr:calcium-binding protein [Alteromonas sp. BMJM2]
MKKLALASLIGTVISANALAVESVEKIETAFAELDNNDNSYIPQQEAKGNKIFAHFSKIDVNSDKKISLEEFNSHVINQPQHFDRDLVASVETMKHNMSDIHDTPSVSTKDERLTYELQENAQTEIKDDEFEPKIDVETDAVAIAKSEFDMMDVNNDGKLTKAEASRSGVTEDFDNIDENGDELISRVEYSTLQRNTDSKSDE